MPKKSTSKKKTSKKTAAKKVAKKTGAALGTIAKGIGRDIKGVTKRGYGAAVAKGKQYKGKWDLIKSLTNPQLMKVAYNYIAPKSKLKYRYTDSQGKPRVRDPTRSEIEKVIMRRVSEQNIRRLLKL